MARDTPRNSIPRINHSVPGERDREDEGRPAGRRRQVDAGDRRFSRCAINNRDVSSHSSAVTRSTFWRDTAASCRVTRIAVVTLRAPSLPPSFSLLSCGSLYLPPSPHWQRAPTADRPTDRSALFMPSYVVKPCQLNYRQTPYAERLSLSRAAWRENHGAVESAIDTAFRGDTGVDRSEESVPEIGLRSAGKRASETAWRLTKLVRFPWKICAKPFWTRWNESFPG